MLFVSYKVFHGTEPDHLQDWLSLVMLSCPVSLKEFTCSLYCHSTRVIWQDQEHFLQDLDSSDSICLPKDSEVLDLPPDINFVYHYESHAKWAAILINK